MGRNADGFFLLDPDDQVPPLLDVTVRDLEAMGILRDFYFFGLIDFGFGGFRSAMPL